MTSDNLVSRWVRCGFPTITIIFSVLLLPPIVFADISIAGRFSLIVMSASAFVVYVRLAIRVAPGELRIRNLFSTTVLDLNSTASEVSLVGKVLRARSRDGQWIRGWGVSGVTGGRPGDSFIEARWARIEELIRSSSDGATILDDE